MNMETAEDVIREMLIDQSAYGDFISDMALRYLKSDKELLQSWLDWFNGTGERPL